MPKTVTPTPSEIDEAFGTNESATHTDDWKKVIPKKDENATGDYPPVWDFEENEELVGLYTQMKTNIGPNLSNQYMIENREDHVTYTVWGSALLDKRFVEIPTDSEVKIVYLGMEKSKQGGRRYKNFDVFFRPANR